MLIFLVVDCVARDGAANRSFSNRYTSSPVVPVAGELVGAISSGVDAVAIDFGARSGLREPNCRINCRQNWRGPADNGSRVAPGASIPRVSGRSSRCPNKLSASMGPSTVATPFAAEL
jgi:hypothetical protein